MPAYVDRPESENPGEDDEVFASAEADETDDLEVMAEDTPTDDELPPPLVHPYIDDLSFERIEQLLSRGQVVEDYGRLRWSSNFTMLVSIRDDVYQTLAIYKPQRGERPLWDFPDGTLCQREVATYIVSRELGWELVAPTVLRDGPVGLGAVQLFIEHDPRITYFQLSDQFIPVLQKLAVFDFIVNNTDRKGGHCLLDRVGKLWAIDHGICFHQYPKLRTVIWDFAGQEVAAPLLMDVEKLCQALSDRKSRVYLELTELLSKAELFAFQQRMERLLKSRKFPVPGSGPNYPWPAI